MTDIDSGVLLSVVNHVFLPPKLPQEAPTEEAERAGNVALCYVLCHVLIQAARAFSQDLSPLRQSLWARMIKMMRNIHWAVKSSLVQAELQGVLSDLAMGGGFSSEFAHGVILSSNFPFRCLRNACSSSECRCHRSRA